MDSFDIVRPESRGKIIFKLNAAFLTVFTVVGADVVTARPFEHIKGGFAVFESDLGFAKNYAAFRHKGFFSLF